MPPLVLASGGLFSRWPWLFTLTPFTTRVLAIVTLPDEIRLRSIYLTFDGAMILILSPRMEIRVAPLVDWMTIAAESSELMVYRRNTSGMNIPMFNPGCGRCSASTSIATLRTGKCRGRPRKSSRYPPAWIGKLTWKPPAPMEITGMSTH
ncbi:hypothetical protein WP1_033 [Pseudomonas phage WP1]